MNSRSTAPGLQPETVDWQMAVPFSQRYGDRYHSVSGARAQALHVFLGGCELPELWQSRHTRQPRQGEHGARGAGVTAPRCLVAARDPSESRPLGTDEAVDWLILETGFGLGLNFLATWQCWRNVRGGPGTDPVGLTMSGACSGSAAASGAGSDPDFGVCSRVDGGNADIAAGQTSPANGHVIGHPVRLRFVSLEAHPVTADDLRRAARQDPALARLGEQLAAAWPIGPSSSAPPAIQTMTPNTCPAFHTNLRNCDRVALRASREIDGIDVDAEAEEVHSSIVDRTTDADPGRIRLSFDDGLVVLEVLLGDARTRLDDWYARHGPLRADSVFLDGFDPRKNPVIWSETTLRSVAAHCRSGTRIATWSVARPVRDALQAAGFQVHKRPGLPPKRDCLAGRFIGGSAVAGAPTLRSGPPPRYRS